MKDDIEKALLHAAARRGLFTLPDLLEHKILSSEAVVQIRENLHAKVDSLVISEAIEQESLVLNRLVQERLISEDALDDLLDGLASPDTSLSLIIEESSKSLPPPETSSSLPSTPGASFGRYTDLQKIGQGGMAEVYKAYDRSLLRHVALKLLKFADPIPRERFLREARLQARVDHPNIAKVYEVGQCDEKPYIAMEYINGRTLKDASEDLATEEKVALGRDIALALHAAHRLGLIHRDVKPSNIMVERNEEGRLVPHVLDFGLARHLEDFGLTETHQIVGTISYMSPEQASGEKNLDRRTDVYSLGVTLYQLLCNHLPFDDAAGPGVLQQIIQDDPVSMRRRTPTVPSDLQTIVMKCLEKDPGARYDSAKALGEDLQRYLDGDTILAKPASFVYRARKKVRKHRAIAATLAAATILVGVFSFLAIRTRLTAQDEAAAAQRFGQSLSRLESAMRIAYLLPLHDTSREKQKIYEQLEVISKEAEAAGKTARGPASYAIGRGYLALKDVGRAREHLLAAWNGGYKEPEVAFGLAIAFGDIYQTKLLNLVGVADRSAREIRRAEIERKYLTPAVKYLSIAKTGKLEASAYAEALLAFYQKQYDHAWKAAAELYSGSPSFYEALLLHGNIRISEGVELSASGEYEHASIAFQEAAKIYQHAAGVAESDPLAYQGIATSNLLLVKVDLEQGRASPQYIDAVRNAATQALTADPNFAEAYHLLADLLVQLAQHQLYYEGADPTESLQEAIKLSQTAQRLRPQGDIALQLEGISHLFLANYSALQGGDPRKHIASALGSYNKARALLGDSPDILLNLGTSHMLSGEYAMEHGEDPRPDFRTAIHFLRNAIRSEDTPENRNTLGLLWMQLGEYLMQQKGSTDEAKKALENAVSEYDQALALNPRLTDALSNQAVGYFDLGILQMDDNLDPEKTFQKSIGLLRQCTELAGRRSGFLNNLGTIYSSWLRYAVQQRLNPAEYSRQALAYLNEASAVAPEDFAPYEEIANVYLWLGNDAILRKGRFDTFFEKALENAAAAKTRKSDSAGAYVVAANTYLEWAEAASEQDCRKAWQLLDNADVEIQALSNINPSKAKEISLNFESVSAKAKLLCDSKRQHGSGKSGYRNISESTKG